MGWIDRSDDERGPTRVLLIDDDPRWTSFVESVFDGTDLNLSITTVNDVETARRQLTNGEYDCVISDYRMPEETGIELLGRIREEQPNIPYILLTAKGSEHLASEAIDAGVDGYLTKELIDQPELFANRIYNTVERKQNVKERIESEERYRVIANTVADAICIYQDGAIVFANDAFCELVGRDRAELATVDPAGFVHEADRNRYADIVADVPAEDVEVRIRDAGGSIRYCRLDATRLTIHEEPATACVFHDVTDRREREIQLERYERFIESSTDVIVVLNADGVVTYQSPIPEATYPGGIPDLLGSNPIDHVHPDDKDDVEASFDRVLADPDRVERTEYRFRMGDGSWRWFENLAQNYLDNPDIEGILVSVRDVHERKRARRQLRRELQLKDAVWDVLAYYSSRNEIAGRFCDLLVRETGADMCCIVVDDGVEPGGVEPAVIGAAGAGSEYVSAVLSGDRSGWASEPTVRALEGSEPVRVDGLAATDAPWADGAADHGLGAAIALPIRYNNIQYGAIGIYLRADHDAGDVSTAEFEDLAEMIGFALSTVSIRQALMADMDRFVRIRFADDRDALAALACHAGLRDAETRIVSVFRGETTDQVYARTDLDPGEVEDALGGLDRVTSFDVDVAPGGETRCRIELAHPSITETIQRHGGILDAGVLADGEVELSVRLPPDVSDNAFVDACRERLDRVRLAASGTVPDDAPARSELLASLTDRQREALEVAFHRGYFEQPKRANAEAIAADLGIGRSTFTQHLRAAQRKLLGTVFSNPALE